MSEILDAVNGEGPYAKDKGEISTTAPHGNTLDSAPPPRCCLGGKCTGNICEWWPDCSHVIEHNAKELFKLERDEQGFVAGISVDGFWVTHLERGTVRNEEYAQWIVDRLNGSDAEMPNGKDEAQDEV